MKLISLLLTSILPAFAAAYASPGACSGACVVHDPAVIKRASDSTYYRFSTGNKINIASATSLSGPWTNLGSALQDGSSVNLAGNQDLWAPDIANVDGTYYLLYSVSSFGSQSSAIGVATSTTMDPGDWTDLGSSGVESSSGSAYNAIDGNLVNTGDGYNMVFGSFWSDIYTVGMSNPPSRSSGSETQIAFNSTGSQALEGPALFPKNGYYYLFFSSGICCGYDSSRPAQGEEYKIMVCRSKNVTGPFVDSNGVSCLTDNGGTTVLTSHDNVYGPGGQGVFTDGSNDVLYYHYVDTDIGYGDGQKQFGWNVIDWSSGWPVV